MVTIAMTKRYRELEYRHRQLVQLWSVLSELRLHTNVAVDRKAAEFYLAKLWTWGKGAPFFTASLHSMMQVFYIELNGMIGAYWDARQQKIVQRKNDDGSLYAYLYDNTRKQRKLIAKNKFETLLMNKAIVLRKVYKLRGSLAHFKKLNERNEQLVPSDREVIEVLNAIAEILYELGYHSYNTPHYFSYNSTSSEAVQFVIDKCVYPPKIEETRKRYLQGRERWIVR